MCAHFVPLGDNRIDRQNEFVQVVRHELREITARSTPTVLPRQLRNQGFSDELKREHGLQNETTRIMQTVRLVGEILRCRQRLIVRARRLSPYGNKPAAVHGDCCPGNANATHRELLERVARSDSETLCSEDLTLCVESTSSLERENSNWQSEHLAPERNPDTDGFRHRPVSGSRDTGGIVSKA